MTITEFSDKHGKRIETVLKWIYDGLIPQASVDNNYVPNSARIPFRSNAKKADSIYESILRASSERKHVCAKTYDLCEQEFLGYIERLVKAGLIVKRVTDNVTYFDSTLSGSEIQRKKVLDALQVVSAGIAYGLSSALMN